MSTTTITKNLDTLAQSILARPQLIKALQASTIVSLGIITGVATCLHTWVIPSLQAYGSPQTKTRQFRHAISLGIRYLQPFSKVFAASLATLTFLFSRSHNPVVQRQWKVYALALAAVLPIAPYEIITVFPSNDRMFEIDDELSRGVGKEVEEQRGREIQEVLTSWRNWHVGRIVMPLVAAGVLAWGAVDLMPL